MRIATTDTIAGVSAVEARELLRRMWRVDEITADDVAESMRWTPTKARRVLGRMAREGLLRRSRTPAGAISYDETAAGGSLRLASAAKPITRQTAGRLLAGLRDRAETMADWEAHPYSYRARAIYVYGSYLRPEVDRLGDVDLAVEWEARFPDDGRAQVDFQKARVRDLRRAGREFGSWYRELAYPFEECVYFLRARKAALSFHRTETREDWAWLAERPHHLWWWAGDTAPTPIGELARRLPRWLRESATG